MSAKHAEKYFDQKDPFNPAHQTDDKYYMNDPFSSEFTPQWWGKGAEALGLEGDIEGQHYSNLLRGMDKGGNSLLHSSAMRGNRTGGWDSAFAPPKSVSILALVGKDQDKRLVVAHDQAVKSVLAYMQENLVQYRDKNVPHNSDNLAVAMYQHSTSRNLDPQLHTHAYIMNLTQTPEGDWRALHNKKIFADQKYMISMYQSELARNVVELGYDLKTKSNGLWEIKGVDPEIIKLFSSRSEEIKSSLKDLRKLYPEAHEAKLRDIANLVTRAEKEDISKGDLQYLWENRLSQQKNHEQQLSEEIKKSKTEESTSSPEFSKEDAERLLKKVAQNISESSSVFNKQYLISSTMDLSRGKLRSQNLEDAYQSLVEKGDLVDYHKDNPDLKNHVVTRAILEKEHKVVELFEKGKGVHEPLMDIGRIENHLQQTNLTDSQRSAVKLMLTSKDRFALIQGDAGTGKTTAVKTAQELLGKSWFQRITKKTSHPEFIGLGFTGRAKTELRDSGGITAMTIDKFLSLTKEEVARNPTYLIDESSMVSTKHFFKLVDRAEKEEARMVFIGDGKQLQAIGSGKLFRDLQEKSNVDLVQMNEVLRQKTPEMIQMVGHIKDYMDGNDGQGIVSALGVLQEQGNLHRSSEREELLSKLTADYFEAKEKGYAPLIATPENKDRAIINESIRAEMIERGELQNEESFEIRRPKSLHNLNAVKSENYAVGDKLYLRNNIGELKAGQQCIIEAVNHDKNSIVVDGTEISLIDHGKNGLSLFTTEEKDFGRGDKIVFLKGDTMLGFDNGQSAMIQSIEGGKISVLLENGKEASFNMNQYPYFDHGYCSTLFKSQGSTCDEILYYAKEGRGNTEDFYTAISRAKMESSLYLESKGTQFDSLKEPEGFEPLLNQETRKQEELKEISQTFEKRQEKTSSLDYETPKELLEQFRGLDAPEKEQSTEQGKYETPKELLEQIKSPDAPVQEQAPKDGPNMELEDPLLNPNHVEINF